MAGGSTLGSATGTSLVAMDFTQSVEPGSGVISISMPSALNQPILVATANGAPRPAVMVRAQVAILSLVVWAVAGSSSDSEPATASSRTTSDLMRRFPLPPGRRRARFAPSARPPEPRRLSPRDPRRARDGAPGTPDG